MTRPSASPLGARMHVARPIAALTAILSLATVASMARGQAPAPRSLAPGVLTVVAPAREEQETVSVHPLASLRDDPRLEWPQQPATLPNSRTLQALADHVMFRRTIWGLEFSFKPLRMLEVDLPGESGPQRKLVWYLVYRVVNPGGHAQPTRTENGTYEVQASADLAIRFLPLLVLETNEFATGPQTYVDQILPAAVAAIRRREDLRRPLLNSVEISQRRIPAVPDGESDGVWGVATWTDVDPRIDFFSIYVAGLTNAFQWEPAGREPPPGRPAAERHFLRKQLQLMFWRPGDAYDEHEGEIRLGTPPFRGEDAAVAAQRRQRLYGVSEHGLEYRWVYR